ncbi:MAG: T9SS type A sorting domain-containing protein [Bacteroidota bacterium]|nr:T9SS type A sorting domain-containing protein [Bacteroidota bacterium]MDP3146537.1 T9SS type A sorting domain-containing protein [Bacteroidota bacterium]MDP3555736.1 T9SS type A sorting domain-containing protein [Bacteroidota bacterium]
MKKLTIIFLFFIVGILNSQTTLIPTGTTNNLVSISIFSNNIIINGRDNYLGKSYNECNSILLLTVPEPVNFQNYLYRVDTNICYMLSTNFSQNISRIYKSINDGVTWTLKFDTTGMNITHMRFFDSLGGIAYAGTYKSLRTTNGGNTWSVGSSLYIQHSAIESYSDSLLCLGTGSGGFIFSKNRGNTWISGGSFTSSSANSYARDFFFLNKDTIFAVSNSGQSGTILSKSFNGGINWQYCQIPFYNDSYGVYFKNKNEGYVVGMDNNSKGIILKTIDLGLTWTTFNTQIQTQLIDIKFLNDSIALISGSGGVLFKWNSKNSLFTGISNYSIENVVISAYPNPIKNKLNIELTDSKPINARINISNSLGQIIYKIDNVNSKQEIDLSFLASGIYYLKVQSNSEQKAFKIIKE